MTTTTKNKKNMVAIKTEKNQNKKTEQIKNMVTIKMQGNEFKMDTKKIRRIIRKNFGLNKKLWEFEPDG